jgi:hypothetical protein
VSQAESDGPRSDVLPVPDRPFGGTLPYDAKDPDASFPAIEPLRPPANQPNRPEKDSDDRNIPR